MGGVKKIGGFTNSHRMLVHFQSVTKSNRRGLWYVMWWSKLSTSCLLTWCEAFSKLVDVHVQSCHSNLSLQFTGLYTASSCMSSECWNITFPDLSTALVLPSVFILLMLVPRVRAKLLNMLHLFHGLIYRRTWNHQSQLRWGNLVGFTSLYFLSIINVYFSFFLHSWSCTVLQLNIVIHSL